MSAISSVGSSNSSAYLLAQASALTSPVEVTADASSSPAATASGQDSASTAGVPASSPLTDLRSQIETAVTSAVSQLPANSSPQDIFDAIRSAVGDTLKANGLNPGQGAGHHGGHHHHQIQAASGGDSASASSDTDGDSNQQSTTDPLLAALQAPASNSSSDPTGSSDASGTQSSAGAIAIFTSGPNAADALSSLLQQLSPGANSQTATAGNSAGQSNSLFAALQSTSSSGASLTAIFQQLFQGFPNGSGLDVQV